MPCDILEWSLDQLSKTPSVLVPVRSVLMQTVVRLRVRKLPWAAWVFMERVYGTILVRTLLAVIRKPVLDA